MSPHAAHLAAGFLAGFTVGGVGIAAGLAWSFRERISARLRRRGHHHR